MTLITNEVRKVKETLRDGLEQMENKQQVQQ